MGFNQTAAKTAVGEVGSGGVGAPEPPDELELQLKNAGLESFDRFSRQPRAVLCGPYGHGRGIPSLVRAYERLAAAGMRVLSPLGFDVVADIDGFVLNRDEVGIPPEATGGVRLNCIRTADLVWLHAPHGHVDASGASAIGFANAAGVPVYAEEMPSEVALCSLVIISSMDQAIARSSTGEKDSTGGSPLLLQEFYSAIARESRSTHKSAHDITLLITEEIGELARQNPGQRHRLSHTSKPAQPHEDVDFAHGAT